MSSAGVSGSPPGAGGSLPEPHRVHGAPHDLCGLLHTSNCGQLFVTLKTLPKASKNFREVVHQPHREANIEETILIDLQGLLCNLVDLRAPQV